MRFTLICDDHTTVLVDGDPRVLGKDVELPQGVSAIQWYGKRGEIEFPADDYGKKPENEEFFDLAPYRYLVDAHAAAKARDEAAQAKAEVARQKAIEAIAEEERARREADRVRQQGA